MEINVIFVNLNIKKKRIDIEIEIPPVEINFCHIDIDLSLFSRCDFEYDLHVNKTFDDIAKPIGEGIIGKSFIVA